MASLITVLLLVVLFIGWIAHLLSTQLYRRLIRKGNPKARGYRIAAFIVSFIVILATVVIVFITNIRIGR